MKTTIYFLITLLLCSSNCLGQIITTVAGSDNTALGDGGPALNASLNGPYGVALDGHGNLYVTDGYHNRIRKIDATGNITTIAGTGVQGYNGDNIPATAAQLYRPLFITFDNSGNLFFCDGLNNRVRKIDINGMITTVAGNGGTAYNGDNIAATNAALDVPRGLVIDQYGNMYITDGGNSRIRKVTTAGIIKTIAGIGVSGYSGDNAPATDAKIDFPYGIALDASGNIYFADSYQNVVRKIDGSGIITTVAGGGTTSILGDNGPATDAALSRPGDIVIGSDNSIYISDGHHQRIRKVVGGIITTVAGIGTLGFSGDNGPATAAELAQPGGICIDPATGAVYFTDFANNRLRRIGWPVGVGELTQKQTNLTIYPNPSTGKFTCAVSSFANEVFNISITDITGRIVKEFFIESGTSQQVELGQPAGPYMVLAKSKTKAVGKTVIIAD